MSNRSKILTWGLPLAGAGCLMLGAGDIVELSRPLGDRLRQREIQRAPVRTEVPA